MSLPITCPACANPMVLDTVTGQGVESEPDRGPYRTAGRVVSTDPNRCEIDRCVSCGGFWFDPGELIVKLRHEAGDIDVDQGWASAEAKGETEMTCPRCQSALGRYSCCALPWLTYFRCSGCHGLWLTGADVERLEDPLVSVLALASGEFAGGRSAP